MRGFAFTLYATALAIIALIAVGELLHQAEMIPTMVPSQIQGRINASLTFLFKEYKGIDQDFGSSNTEFGCAPVVILNLKDDPIEELAKPYIYYRCG